MDLPAPDRLSRQLTFILEIDRLKGVLRRTLLADGSRNENSAEHSWHIAVAAVLLAEHAAAEVEVGRVVRMLLVHDVVEIDAGDTYAYDAGAHDDKADRERTAAERLFALLPPDQEREMWDLWQEFEAADSAEARFANAVDRLMPMLHNYVTRGAAWQEHGVRSHQVVERNRATIDIGAPELWAYAERMVAAAVDKGYLSE
jgi:putative hydrolase of HD superfamily